MSRPSLAVWLLCSACAIGGAGFDEQGRPEVWGAALWSEVKACPPEREDACASVGAGGLSENAADAVRESGLLTKLRDAGNSAMGWLASKAVGLLF